MTTHESPANDPRLTLARADLAADHLEGIVKAARYVAPTRYRITTPIVNLYKTPHPDPTSAIETQWLYGEDIDVLDITDGWAFGQSLSDGYVGYCPAETLTKADGDTTHRITNLLTPLYAKPNIKSTPIQTLSYGSHVTVIGQDGLFFATPDGFVPLVHCEDKTAHAMEAVSEAFRFLGVPYVWGGRSGMGIDCSALLQLCFQACGIPFPRDMDLQALVAGKTIARAELQTGDLIFFAHDDGKKNLDGTLIHGHIGIMVDNTMMIHANETAMAVSMDDLDDYLALRGKTGKTTRHHGIRLK